MQKRHLTNNLSQQKLSANLETGKLSKLIKDIYAKPTVNTVVNDERLNTFPLSSRIRQGCSFSPLPF